MPGGNRPTLREVAREAGLSVTQTSRALNGHADVAAGTRDRVAEVAQRLEYVPNLEARRLKKPESRSHCIGLVLATDSQRFSDPFFGDLLTALADGAAENRYELQLSAPLADEDPVASYRRAVRAKRVDGFVVLRAARADPRVHFLADSDIPFVTFGRTDETGDHPAVDESIDCLRPAVDHLVGLGHRRIGCVIEPLEYAIAARRHESFHGALRANGIEPDQRDILGDGFREDDGFEATMRLLDRPDPPTALVAFNDLLAIGAMRAAAVRGVRVPEQLSVIGFDDVDAARVTAPPLTTLRQPAAAVGRLLVTQLLAAIEEPGRVGDVFVTPELVIRRSTAPPPQSSS